MGGIRIDAPIDFAVVIISIQPTRLSERDIGGPTSTCDDRAHEFFSTDREAFSYLPIPCYFLKVHYLLLLVFAE